MFGCSDVRGRDEMAQARFCWRLDRRKRGSSSSLTCEYLPQTRPSVKIERTITYTRTGRGVALVVTDHMNTFILKFYCVAKAYVFGSHASVRANELRKPLEFKNMSYNKVMAFKILKEIYWTHFYLHMFWWSNCTYNVGSVEVTDGMGCVLIW